MRKPVVHLYTVCWDEADMLGFFFRHYDPWVDRYVIYDDDSTDGSRDILRAHPKVELRRFVRTNAGSFVLSHTALQNEVWKESRLQADWVVVTAIDEHLWVRNQPMADYLAAQARIGVTLIPALGFDLNGRIIPEDRGLLIHTVTRGRPRLVFNKLSIFNPDALQDVGFAPGRHRAEPVGNLRLPARDEVMLWHYKHLDFERNAAREARQALRLDQTDLADGLGQHYLRSKQQLRLFWDEMERQSTDLAAAGFAPDRACTGPLWWRHYPGMVSVAQPCAQAVAAAPTVSVLVKAFNHASYIRQTIESVLTQSFQDFEIVVTDDGSTDGTLEVLRGFTDPRIRVEALGSNRGISLAMNATIARARGRYLAILNSDDWALPDRLQRQVSFLDAHPDISLLFGLPQAVDEVGNPTVPFNDFEAPLMLTDFSRRSWLRHFFYHGNCLCAPTAMIRREAYNQVGLYDPRLTNLQDFDMWVRMLITGHAIHVLSERLIAFRIRDNAGNMSAPRPDTLLRHAFEMTRVLRHFGDLDTAAFQDTFAADLTEAYRSNLPVRLQLAVLAARHPRIEYKNLALQLFFENAHEVTDFCQLRLLSGTVDAFGIQQVANAASVIAELQDRHALLQHEVAQLEQVRTAIEQSVSWRITRPMRMVSGRLPRSWRRVLRPE